MATILQTVSRSPYRITIALNATPSTTASDYTITRTDGSPSTVEVNLAWLTGVNTVELALTEKLQTAVQYTIAVAGSGSATVGFRSLVAPPPRQPFRLVESDPVEDAYGVDLGWIGNPGPLGRPVRRTGVPCINHDLAAALKTNKAELVHRPDEGAGLTNFVNGPNTRAARADLLAACRQQVAKDRRVRDPQVSVESDPTGSVLVPITYTPTPSTKQESFSVNAG